MTEQRTDAPHGHDHNHDQPSGDATALAPVSVEGWPDVSGVDADAAVSGARDFTEAALAAAATDVVADSLDTLVHAAVQLVPCRWAAIAVLDERLTVPARTRTATDPALFETVMQIAIQAGTSPGWDAARHGGTRYCPDLTTETHYGSWAPDMLANTPIRAAAAAAFDLYDDQHPGGVLNVYADHPKAFDDTALTRLQLLADHCSLVINQTSSAHRANTLQAGLANARIIGAAIGILIERHRLTYDQAFDMLRNASQNSNRKLRDIAETLLHTGVLPHHSPDTRHRA